MPSPFPGMDPFLEAHWGDVHTSLTTYARDQLRPQLPRDLTARIEESVHLDAGDDADRRVVERVNPLPRRSVNDPSVSLAATPVLVSSDDVVALRQAGWRANIQVHRRGAFSSWRQGFGGAPAGEAR